MTGQRTARPASILVGHVVYMFLNALLFANTPWIMPLLVRLRFGAADPHWRDWQTTLVTAALPVFMMLSIFWGELLRRVTLRTYLLLLWLVAVFPLGCVALVESYWQLLACHVVATMGLGGATPLNGRLLEHFYPAALRGRAFAVLNAVALVAGIASVYAVGAWMERDPDAFRFYFPIAAAIQLVGLAVLGHLARRTDLRDETERLPARTWSDLLRPVWHMGRVLRADRNFLRYERAFMTYGAAFMLCDALLPVLATDKLHVRYEDYAHSTQVMLRLSTLLLTLPMGWLNDRIGSIRTSAVAFAVLGAYPILLLLVRGPFGLGVASAVYGVGMAGVAMGWMLGPVALAGSAEKVPQYTAIHATLVGVRGIIFQGAGMLFYKLTGSFVWPLLAAAAAFLWATAQMHRLHRSISAETGSPAALSGVPALAAQPE